MVTGRLSASPRQPRREVPTMPISCSCLSTRWSGPGWHLPAPSVSCRPPPVSGQIGAWPSLIGTKPA